MLLFGLLAAAIQDLKEHKVWIGAAFPAAVMHLFMLITGQKWSELLEICLGTVIVVLILALIYRSTRGGIGTGDIWIQSGISLTLGPWDGAGVWLLAMFLAAGVSMVLLASGKIRRKDRLPFVPFLAGACLCYVVMSLTE